MFHRLVKAQWWQSQVVYVILVKATRAVRGTSRDSHGQKSADARKGSRRRPDEMVVESGFLIMRSKYFSAGATKL